MTSKELIDICDTEITQTRGAMRVWEAKTLPSHIYGDKYIRFLRGVKKQLKVLEILKDCHHQLKEARMPNNELFMATLTIHIPDEEYLKKVKEWLDE